MLNISQVKNTSEQFDNSHLTHSGSRFDIVGLGLFMTAHIFYGDFWDGIEKTLRHRIHTTVSYQNQKCSNEKNPEQANNQAHLPQWSQLVRGSQLVMKWSREALLENAPHTLPLFTIPHPRSDSYSRKLGLQQQRTISLINHCLVTSIFS
jgi:hypothetical protein